MRNQYYTKPLVKAINEMYFRKYRHIGELKEITEAVPSIDITTYKIHLVNNKIKDIKLFNLLCDLQSVIWGKLEDFKSNLGKSLYVKLDHSKEEVTDEIGSK